MLIQKKTHSSVFILFWPGHLSHMPIRKRKKLSHRQCHHLHLMVMTKTYAIKWYGKLIYLFFRYQATASISFANQC
jgi:hypothetical protein